MLLFSQNQTESSGAGTGKPGGVTDSLIAEIADGDTGALSALYAQSKTAVYGFALSILRSRQDAEDVMQDTYLRIYASAAQYRPQGKPMAWILTIVRNLSLMKLREQSKNEPLPQEDWNLPDPRDPITQRLDRMLLEAAMQVLSGEERQIVMLHAVAGQKHREIAGLLQLPLPTVLSKYRRALSKLNKKWKEDGHDDR